MPNNIGIEEAGLPFPTPTHAITQSYMNSAAPETVRGYASDAGHVMTAGWLYGV